MDRSQQFKDGYRRAVKDAVAWLHARADEMNDPSAKAALNTAAFNFGSQAKGKLDPMQELADQAQELDMGY